MNLVALQMNIEPAEIDWGIAELDLSLSSGMADPTIFNLLHTLTVRLEPPHSQTIPCAGVSRLPACACVQNLKQERTLDSGSAWYP